MPEPQHDVCPFEDFLFVHFGTLFDKKRPNTLYIGVRALHLACVVRCS